MTKGSKILVVYMAKIPTTKLIMDMMKRLVAVTGGKLRGRASADVKKNDIEWADLVLFTRGADPLMAEIGKSAYEAGRYCIMYLDDDLLNVPSNGIRIYKNALKECLHWCHLLWSSNPNILKKYSSFMQEPKCVEEKVFEPIDELLPVNQDTDEIRIVYAGSPSHALNLQRYIVPALNDLCEKYSNMKVTFIGLEENDLKKVKFRAEYVSWFDNYDKYKKYISENRYHIGLAVVPDTEFSRCKFYNKFLEYSKMGVLGIYSDCEPYRFIIKNGENGLLSRNFPNDWKNNIEKAITDHELRKSCVENAQKLIQSDFDMDTVLQRLIANVPECVNFQSDGLCKVHYNRKNKIISKISSAFWLMVHYLYMFTLGRRYKNKLKR